MPTSEALPSERISTLGTVQEGAPVLSGPTLPFDLPHEADDARQIVAELQSAMPRVTGHLAGLLYRSRMLPGTQPIPVTQYRGTGQQWNYPA
ncbi:hypothetical protein ACL02S_15515 [Nocardia sp. 004]|uniref:hypothetical protein n=1 Tax=Nocardia sp. 004 TaxID=3385978 RepID=UPI0039A33EAB